ncbi:DUF4296 domain-containing protein [Subsaxibacter sp. CAU 1640]|uniref:DUF4296 domain-containing protein n=1 Tax=Subsaxibacter sp. CAU 1640 TaxID=2933271 RepID=UPI002002B79A|nr:DUF4296 domain-containing protein [Subsaxibacter sp. CAU 1640]MCK7589158.1 DUF4296 domain-containing protein [Subsaxibacter sp. CAU 1640]
MKNTIYILVLTFMVSCGDSDRPAKPDNLIPQETMSNIIYDVFLLNAAKGINKQVLEKNNVLPQDYVYKKYSIDSLQFALSNEYYSYDTKTYETIMDRVKSRLEFEKKKNDSIGEIERKTKDSLDRIKRLIPKPDSLPLEKPKLKPKVFGQGD